MQHSQQYDLPRVSAFLVDDRIWSRWRVPFLILGAALGALLWFWVIFASNSPTRLRSISASDPFENGVHKWEAPLAQDGAGDAVQLPAILTATIVSDTRQVAIINGSVYRSGDILLLGEKESRVLSVEPGMVRLWYQGQAVSLKLRS